jgi:hypothetical protein
LKFYKLFWKFNNNKTTYKEFCGCLETGLCNIWWFIFWVIDPSILRGHNFFNSILFLTIFSALNVLIKRVQILFKRQKQWSPPLGSGLLWAHKCYSCNWITTNEQLKDLTDMFCLQIPCYKLYKEGFSFMFSHQNTCVVLGWVEKV